MAVKLYAALYGGKFASVVELDSAWVDAQNAKGEFLTLVEWLPHAEQNPPRYGDMLDDTGQVFFTPELDATERAELAELATTLDAELRFSASLEVASARTWWELPPELANSRAGAPTLDSPWPENRRITYAQRAAELAAAEVQTTDPTALLIARFSGVKPP